MSDPVGATSEGKIGRNSVSIAHFKSENELLDFARKFFDDLVETFQKDIAICRTPDAGGRHAYFPALISCIAFAELLSGLYAGKLNGLKLKDLEQYAKDFMEPEYTSHRRRLELLYEGLRHKVAHLAYPYPVMPHGKPRRLVTWSIHETEERPAIEIVDYSPPRQLVQTRRPWPVSYDCRIEVRVGSLATDITNSIYGQSGYLKHLQSNQKAREDFAKCMRQYFPRSGTLPSPDAS